MSARRPTADIWSELEWRRLVHQATDPELADVLRREAVTAYIGFDPSADSLHVGHLLQLCTLRRLQGAGHRPIALAGGGTGMIGDPGGKSEERNLLTREQLDANLASIRGQLERFLDFSDGRALLLDNGEWLRRKRPGNVLVQTHLARCLDQVGRPEQAARLLDEVLLREPRLGLALLERGKRTATLTAATPCKILPVPARDVSPGALSELSEAHRREG